MAREKSTSNLKVSVAAKAGAASVTAARVAATFPPPAGSAPGASATTGTVRVRLAYSGTQVSSQTRKVTSAFRVAVDPAFAETGTWIGTGSSTSPE